MGRQYGNLGPKFKRSVGTADFKVFPEQILSAFLIFFTGNVPLKYTVQKIVGKIVLVDSSPDHAESARNILSGSSAEIVYLTRGEQILEYLFDDPATALPSLVILHLGRPHHFAVEILERMRAEPATKKIPVLILADSIDEQHLLDRFEFELCFCAVNPLTFGKLVYALPALGMTINESVLYTKMEGNGSNLARH